MYHAGLSCGEVGGGRGRGGGQLHRGEGRNALVGKGWWGGAHGVLKLSRDGEQGVCLDSRGPEVTSRSHGEQFVHHPPLIHK